MLPHNQEFTISVLSENNEKYQIEYYLSNHAIQRSISRSISHDSIKLSLIYGKPFFKQGLTFYFSQKKNIPEPPLSAIGSNSDNIVVVADDNSGTILTVYRCTKGNIHLRKKGKQLMKYAA